jgi:hypothetical protein
MAVLDWSGKTRTEGVTSRGKRYVDVVLTGSTGANADTINPATVGLSQIDEIYHPTNVTLTNPKSPALTAALAAGTYRLVGS